jgi:type VI secretion system protein ImpH
MTAPIWRALEAAPWAHGFFSALRRIEAAYPHLPRLGRARRRADEPLRLGQWPSMSFAPATLGAVQAPADGRPGKVTIRFFGLWGPNGPLPLHLTEYARERCRRTPADGAMAAFADVFHHRLLALLYAAWAEAEPVVAADRAGDGEAPGAFDRMQLAWAGLLSEGVPPPSKARLDVALALACTGWLCGGARSAEGVRQVLQAALGVAVRVHEWPVRWREVARADRSVLASRLPCPRLAHGTPIGTRIRDASSTLRIDLGPFARERYERLQPGGADLPRLRDLVRHVIDPSVVADVRLVLCAADVATARLGPDPPALGGSCWIGRLPNGARSGRRWRWA